MPTLELSDIVALRLRCTNPNCKQANEPIPLDKAERVVVHAYQCPHCKGGPLSSSDVVWMQEVFTIARAILAVSDAQQRYPHRTKFKVSFEVRPAQPIEKLRRQFHAA